MKNMSFVKTPEEMGAFAALGNAGIQFRNQEGLFVAWETNPEVVKKLVPAPLEPVAPVAWTYISYFHETNFSRGYTEGGLFIPVKHNGKIMNYCVAMPIAGGNDMPIMAGREMMGFPKKLADDIHIVRQGDHVKAYIERHGIRYIEVEAEIGEYNSPQAADFLGDAKAGDTVDTDFLNLTYNFEFGDELSINNIKLLDIDGKQTYKSFEKANAKVTLTPSIDDPWAELEVVKVLGATYCKYELDLIKGNVVAEPDIQQVFPYLFARWDSAFFGHEYRELRS